MRKRLLLILYLLIPPVVVWLSVPYLKRKPSATPNVPAQTQPVAQKAASTPVELAEEKPAEEKPAEEKLNSASKPTTQPTPSKFPRSMKDVKVTEKLAQAIERERQSDQPDIYERLDYRLRFFASLADCLGNYKPAQGEMLINLLFLADLDRKMAVGVGPDELEGEGALEAFNIQESTFGPEDEERIIECAMEAHVGKELDIQNTSLPWERLAQAQGFYFPTYIRFPLEENDVYWFINHEGEHRPRSKLVRKEEDNADQH